MHGARSEIAGHSGRPPETGSRYCARRPSPPHEADLTQPVTSAAVKGCRQAGLPRRRHVYRMPRHGPGRTAGRPDGLRSSRGGMGGVGGMRRRRLVRHGVLRQPRLAGRTLTRRTAYPPCCACGRRRGARRADGSGGGRGGVGSGGRRARAQVTHVYLAPSSLLPNEERRHLVRVRVRVRVRVKLGSGLGLGLDEERHRLCRRRPASSPQIVCGAQGLYGALGRPRQRDGRAVRRAAYHPCLRRAAYHPSYGRLLA